jgi:hypothetical protein
MSFWGVKNTFLTSTLNLVKKDFGLLTFTCLNAYFNRVIQNSTELARTVSNLDQSNGILLMFCFQNVNVTSSSSSSTAAQGQSVPPSLAPWAHAAVRNGAQ